MTRSDVVKILDEISVLLEIKGENPFKSLAYQRGARILETLDEDFDEWVRSGRLAAHKGIGDALSKKITELVTTGRLPYYEDLKASIPPGLVQMLRIPGLGPKKIRTLYDKLHIETLGELEYACHENRLIDLTGFGQKTQDKILAGLSILQLYDEKHLHAQVLPRALAILQTLTGLACVQSSSLAGSLRRSNEVVKDMDLLVASEDPAAVGDFFVALPEVESVTGQGTTKVSVVLSEGLNADLRIVSEAEFPYALHHFTGSREHNTAMRGRARKMGLKMNEYGLFTEEGNIPCASEEEIFAALGLPFIPPELRENLGEIEAAERLDLPRLITGKDVRGIFHIHTRASDGNDSIEALARQARALGYEYIGISDHSRSAAYAGGLSVSDLERQHAEIDEINAREVPFHIFKGIEADILPDGRLDYDDEILERFDFVIAAIHSNFGMAEEAMTRRILTTLAHPLTTILAHPTGRILLAREPYALDLQAVIDFAAETGVVLELNANPQRLDLDWRQLIYAKKRGVRIAINPDIHRIDGFGHMEPGVRIARKGWLETNDCINCLDLQEVTAFLDRKRRGDKRKLR